MRRANGSKLGVGPTLLFGDCDNSCDMVSMRTNDALNGVMDHLTRTHVVGFELNNNETPNSVVPIRGSSTTIVLRLSCKRITCKLTSIKHDIHR